MSAGTADRRLVDGEFCNTCLMCQCDMAVLCVIHLCLFAGEHLGGRDSHHGALLLQDSL